MNFFVSLHGLGYQGGIVYFHGDREQCDEERNLIYYKGLSQNLSDMTHEIMKGFIQGKTHTGWE